MDLKLRRFKPSRFKSYPAFFTFIALICKNKPRVQPLTTCPKSVGFRPAQGRACGAIGVAGVFNGLKGRQSSADSEAQGGAGAALHVLDLGLEVIHFLKQLPHRGVVAA